MHFCRHPPPRPRLRRSSPAPSRGAGSVRGDIRGAAVSGVEPMGSRARFFSGISPCTGPWGYRHWGRGNSFPLPCLSRSNHLTSRQHPLPTPSWVDIHTLLPAPPPRPRLRRSSPAPGGGGVRAWRYQVSSRIRGFSRISPCAGPWGYRGWGWGQRGGGTCSPSPVSSSPDTVIHVVPTPPAPPGSSHEADRAAIAMRRGGPPLPADGHL